MEANKMTRVGVVKVNKVIKNILGRLAGATGIYTRRFRSRMTIIAFHRVSRDLPEDGLTCTPEKFDAFCAFFKKYFRVVSFAEQVSGCAQGRDMGGTLSITFDDGYRDNFEVAAPILLRHRLPATFFVATGFVGSDHVPPWDRNLPRQPGWMTWDQVRALAAQGFDIGAHTVSHINMAAASVDAIRFELSNCKSKLEHELSRPVTLFVYPFGGPDQISPESIKLVREAGFVSCASCYGGTNQPVSDPFDLKRIGIAEWYSTPHQFGAEWLLGKV